MCVWLWCLWSCASRCFVFMLAFMNICSYLCGCLWVEAFQSGGHLRGKQQACEIVGLPLAGTGSRLCLAVSRRDKRGEMWNNARFPPTTPHNHHIVTINTTITMMDLSWSCGSAVIGRPLNPFIIWLWCVGLGDVCSVFSLCDVESHDDAMVIFGAVTKRKTNTIRFMRILLYTISCTTPVKTTSCTFHIIHDIKMLLYVSYKLYTVSDYTRRTQEQG